MATAHPPAWSRSAQVSAEEEAEEARQAAARGPPPAVQAISAAGNGSGGHAN